MANEQNLKTPTSKEARENGRKGGLASAEARRKKRDMRLALELLLERDISKDGKTMTTTEAISIELINQALKGNVKAYETIRATVGQDPVQKVQVAEIPQNVIDEVEKMVLEE